MEGNLFFKIDRASLIVGSKFTVFALFSFLFEGNFPSTQAPGGASIWRGDLTDGFLRYRLGAGAHNNNNTYIALIRMRSKRFTSIVLQYDLEI